MPVKSIEDAAGAIGGCASAGCGYTCCEFAQGNYIVLPPGEVEEAQSRGERLDHLELTPLAFGGWRAVCHARETATCDHGYKPLDCCSYPFFPVINANDTLAADLKGAKCPLAAHALTSHRRWVERAWNRLLATSPRVREWLRRVRLVGYESLSDR